MKYLFFLLAGFGFISVSGQEIIINNTPLTLSNFDSTNTNYQLYRGTPVKTADSTYVISGIKFGKGFKAFCSFKQRNVTHKRGFSLALALGSDDSPGCTWIGIGPSKLIILYYGGDHPEKRKRKIVYLQPKLLKNDNTLFITEAQGKYQVFVNDKFVKEFRYEAIEGNELRIVPLHNKPFVNHFFSIIYNRKFHFPSP